MLQFFISTCRSGLRGRGFLAILFLGVALVGMAYLSASFSPRQPRTVALDVGLSGLRFSLVLFALMLAQELIGREIGQRSIILQLSYPIPRSSYLLGRYLGIVFLVGVAAVVLALLLLLAVIAAGLHYDQQFPVELGVSYWATIVAMVLDVAVVCAFAAWIASLSTVTQLPLALGAIFAIAGKALGPVADYLAKGAEGDTELVNRFAGIIDKVIWVLPDLSRLDWRTWPMYALAPDAGTIGLALLMALAYIGLMLGLAVLALSRRQFS